MSLLTNNSAMVALQTLKGINKSLEGVQSQISTGKEVASAKDNAAVWAISKVMESDVKGFKAISDSLALGESTVAVGRNAAETITDLLTDIKGKIVDSQEENVDRDKIQADVDALVKQIESVTGAAQFNGLNLVEGQDDVNVLSSLDRANNGTVSASEIKISRQDLTTETGSWGGGAALNPNAAVSDTAANALNSDGNTAVITMNTNADYSAATAQFTIANTQVTFAAGELGTGDQDAAASAVAAKITALGIEGITASATGADITITSKRAFEGVSVDVDSVTGNAASTAISAVNGAAPAAPNTGTSSTIEERSESITFDSGATVEDGDGYRASFGGGTFTYVAGQNENMQDVANGLKAAIDGERMEGITTKVVENADGDWVLKIDNDSDTDMTLAAIGNKGGEASGGLFGLDKIDVTTDEGAEAALANVEVMIDTAIDSAAEFGSVQGRIEMQSDFVGSMIDNLKSGIGSLVDADMEETSARLQALQVQQQLGTQSLSIANQAPQSILSLFR